MSTGQGGTHGGGGNDPSKKKERPADLAPIKQAWPPRNDTERGKEAPDKAAKILGITGADPKGTDPKQKK